MVLTDHAIDSQWTFIIYNFYWVTALVVSREEKMEAKVWHTDRGWRIKRTKRLPNARFKLLKMFFHVHTIIAFIYGCTTSVNWKRGQTCNEIFYIVWTVSISLFLLLSTLNPPPFLPPGNCQLKIHHVCQEINFRAAERPDNSCRQQWQAQRHKNIWQ